LFVINTHCSNVKTSSSLSSSPPPLSSFYWPEQWYGTWRFWNSSGGGSLLEYGWWFYDYPNQFLRMDNTLAFCPNPNGTGFVFCEGVFLGSAGNFYLYAPEIDICCLCIPKVGLTPPNWVDVFANSSNTSTNNLYQPLSIRSNLATMNMTGERMQLQFYYQSILSGNPVALSGDPDFDPTGDQWLDTTRGPVPDFANNLPGGGNLCQGSCPAAFGCGPEPHRTRNLRDDENLPLLSRSSPLLKLLLGHKKLSMRPAFILP